MKIAPMAEVKARFNKYIKHCEEGHIVVTKNGRPAAVLVSILDDEELERFILAYTPKFRKLLDSAFERIKKGGGIKHKDFWKSI